MFLRVVSATAIGVLAFAATGSARLAPDHDMVRSPFSEPSPGTAVSDGPADSRGVRVTTDGGFEWRIPATSDGGFEWGPTA